MAWYAAIAANAMAMEEPISRSRDWRCTAPTNKAIESSQKARKGTSASSELPLTMNAGVARNSSVAESGYGLNRCASESALNAAINEKRM